MKSNYNVEVACIIKTVAKSMPQPDAFIWKRFALPEVQKETSEAIRRDSAGKRSILLCGEGNRILRSFSMWVRRY